MQVTLKPLISIDDGTRIASFRYYDGVNNNIFVAHNEGWGEAQTEIADNCLLCSLIYEFSSSYYQGYYVRNTLKEADRKLCM